MDNGSSLAAPAPQAFKAEITFADIVCCFSSIELSLIKMETREFVSGFSCSYDYHSPNC